MASSSSPPTPPLKERKLSSSSVEENHQTATTDAAFQYLPDVKTTDCSKFDGKLFREEIIGEILGYLLYWDKPASVSASFLRFDSTNSKVITNFTYRSTHGEITSSGYDLAGTCSGIICLANDEDFTPEVPAIIWNPSVRKLVTLPPSTITIPWTNEEEEEDNVINLPYYISTSFGYDLSTNDY
ncbi:hypothetical protein ACFX13_044052 [Malus domestica]